MNLLFKKIHSTKIVTLCFATATVVDRIVAAISMVLIIRLFGVSELTDAYFVIIFLPVTIGIILNDISYATILQLFSKTDNNQEVWRYICKLVKFSITSMAFLAGLFVLFAPFLMHLQAPGFSSATFEFSERVFRWASLLLIFVGVGGVFSNILIARDQIVAGAFRQPIGSIVALGVSLYLAIHNNMGVKSFVYGLLVGHFITFTISAFAVVRIGEGRKFIWRDTQSSEPFRQLFVNSTLTIVTNASYYLMVFVERFVASMVAPGAITLINMGRVFVTIMGFLPSSFANAWYQRSIKKITFTRSVNQQIHLIQDFLYYCLLLGAPILVVTLLVYQDALAFLFKAKLHQEQIIQLQSVTSIMIAGFLHVFLLGALIRVFQSINSYKGIVYFSIIGLALDIFLLWILGKYYGIIGLAWAYTIALTMETFVAVILLIPAFTIRILQIHTLKLMLAGCATYVSTYTVMDFINISSFIPLVLFASIVVMIVFSLIGMLIRLPYLQTSFALVWAKVKRGNCQVLS